MRIHVLSDLHLEYSSFLLPPEQTDVVVLAGDIAKHTDGLRWVLSEIQERPVGCQPAIIYVIGNHEFYGAEVHGIRKQLKSMAELARGNGIRVWILDNDAVEIDGIRFLGATLWTDYQLFGPGIEMAHAMRDAERYLNDHRVIRCSPHAGFKPSQALGLHRESVSWLTGELGKPFLGRTVVVTHHLPSVRSVAERFKKDFMSGAFASHLDHLVERADLWIHGHTHDNFDYQLGKCRVVCNPRGYVRNRHDGISIENHEFNPGFVVEL